MVTVKDISDYIDSFAPYSTQCEWDNCGILVGDEGKTVNKVGFVLDLTAESLKDAEDKNVDLIITHHPVIFKAQKSFLKGNSAFDAAVKGISVLSAHTCFDCAEGGVNDVLCDCLGIKSFEGVPSEECAVPMARIGELLLPSASELAKLVAEKLGTVCRVTDSGKEIKKVAVCGGAGGDFLKDAVNMGADAYVTGDMSHHEFLLAEELGLTVIAAGHFETENPAVSELKNKVCSRFTEIDGVILKQTNPVKYIG
ncbi:MAG: Nif3-like dinuclear metal center hexameric protein [Clostridia bacterium]|nr:Nif3-like dinuclear metal center hexameric protein [Clostridia bacterium]